MSKILFDQNMSRRLRPLLLGHQSFTAEEMNWDLLKNGVLLKTAEADGFDVLITGDTKMYGQQRHLDRRIAILLLIPNRWAVIQQNPDLILEALAKLKPGGYEKLILLEDGLPAPAKAGGKRR